MSGVNQLAMAFAPVYSSGATTSGTGIYVLQNTPAVAFTMASSYGIYIDNPFKGAGSSITTAYGLYVAAQSAGATNWGVYSLSAPNFFGGDTTHNAQTFAPNITTSSAAQTGTVCWTTGTGKFTVDTTVGCLTSIMAAKNITEHLSPEKALDLVARLDPFAFRYKSGWGDSGRYEQFGFGAEQVALVDERMVGRDPGGNLQGVRYQELTAVLAGAIQQLKADNDNLRDELKNLKRNNR